MQFTKVNGKTVKDMEKVNNLGKMDLIMKVIGKMDGLMVMDD